MLTSIKFRLTVMSFMQFFVWGAWLTTIFTYGTEGKGWSIPEVGAIFSTLALSSIFMPSLIGIIADKWINTERLYGILQIAYGLILVLAVPTAHDPESLYWIIFGAMICYMPTISLSNSISYRVLESKNLDVVKDFPPIRVWGTIGFILAMIITNRTGSNINSNQFIFAGIGAIALGAYAFSLPKCPPENLNKGNRNIINLLGLDAFKLFANYKMFLFFMFSMLLGAALQLSNMYGEAYLFSFPKGTITNEYSGSILAISQISETLFILTIPFFLKRFGIKKVMLLAMFAWFLRYGLFAFGGAEFGFILIFFSNVIYGMAFDFFNISGSMFIETNTDHSIRSSAQGLFMMMTNGFGAFMGTKVSSWVIATYFTTSTGATEWQGTWIVFSLYSLVVAILFMILFKHKHDPEHLSNIKH